jgi:hypothetical protein
VISVFKVLRILSALRPCYGEIPDHDHLVDVAVAIATVAETKDDAIGLITIGDAESKFCKRVHSGEVRGGPGEGIWQLEPGSHRKPPYSGLSADATIHAAGEALWLWRHSYSCGSSLTARFRVYGGVPCEAAWAGAKKRADLYVWISWLWERSL